MEELQVPAPASRIWRAVPYVAAVVIAVAGLGYAVYERTHARNLASQNQQVTAQLNATHSQLDALVARVDALSASGVTTPGAANSSAVKPAAKASPAGNAPGNAAAHRPGASDARFNKLQSQLDAQGKAIDDTRNDLTSARTELSGSIAKTHDDLVLLEKRGERNYYEFDLQKAKQFKREGPLSVSLRKANEKRQYADLQLIVDDRTLTQKHVNLYQPAMFYAPDSTQPMEIVINEISKDHIHGYISAPKYRQSDLTAAGNTGANTANANPQLSVRQKLPLPDSGPVQ